VEKKRKLSYNSLKIEITTAVAVIERKEYLSNE